MRRPPVKSALRVFEVLELFDKLQKPLRVSDVVDELEYPQSSVSSLMQTLLEKGYLDFYSESRSFFPTPRLAFLGHWAMGHPESVEVIQNTLRWLVDQTGESAALGARSGTQLQYVHFMVSEGVLKFTVAPGATRPLHRTTLGLLHLSLETDEEIGKVVRRYNADNPDQDPANLADVLTEVHRAREQGYLCTESKNTMGVSVLGTLLPFDGDSRALAIGIGGPAERIRTNMEDFTAIVLKAAQMYSRRMEELHARPRHSITSAIS